MQNSATSPNNARFWVRPYEFEGDGSTGAALDVATVEVAGKTRTFWLKTLENRLFFRETGRDENWNFGAIEELSESEKSDLPMALANVLTSENYGRVVLPSFASRPKYLLVSPDDKFSTRVPNVSATWQSDWKPQSSARVRPFLDWSPGVFGSIANYQRQQIPPDYFAMLQQTPVPVMNAYWARGSQPEWERVVKSFFVYYLSRSAEPSEPSSLTWRLHSAWSLGEMSFWHYQGFPKPIWMFPNFGISRSMQKRLRFIKGEFRFAGQKEGVNGSCRPLTLQGIVTQPTHHEILEAHLYLRDWIHQRLPPERARQWLDFS